MAKTKKKSPFKLPETAPLPKKNPRRYGNYDMELMPPRPPYGGYSKEEVSQPLNPVNLNDLLKRHVEQLYWMKQKNPFMSIQEQV